MFTVTRTRNRSDYFLVTDFEFYPPSIEINLGGQALERWPHQLFVSEDLVTEALGHFINQGELEAVAFLDWYGTVSA